MHQLAGADAFHVLEETPDQHMHTVKIALIGDRDGHPVTVDDVLEWAAARLPRIPPLRWTVRQIPLGLGRPVFLDAGPVDVRRHVRTETLPPPGGEAEFEAAVSRIASTVLPRDRPLWDLTVIGGRADGHLALVFKFHHAIMDGLASVRFFELAFDRDPPDPATGPELDRFPPPPAAAEPVPSPAELVAFALRSQIRQYAGLPAVLRRTLRSIRVNRARKASGLHPVANPLSGPHTRFNDPVRADRVYTDVTLPLPEVRRLKAAAGATLNEVFVTICGGGLRRYLDAHGELPRRPMNASNPVSLRRPEEIDAFGNRTTYWYVALGTEVADPVARLQVVRDSIAAAKAWAQGDVELFAVWMDYYLLFGLVTLRLLNVIERVSGRPAINATVSNVKGPPPLRLAGAPVVAVRSMGPLTRRYGLNFTVWSYRDNFSIGIHACAHALPDPQRLAAALRDEYDAMRRAYGLDAAPSGIALENVT